VLHTEDHFRHHELEILAPRDETAQCRLLLRMGGVSGEGFVGKLQKSRDPRISSSTFCQCVAKLEGRKQASSELFVLYLLVLFFNLGLGRRQDNPGQIRGGGNPRSYLWFSRFGEICE